MGHRDTESLRLAEYGALDAVGLLKQAEDSAARRASVWLRDSVAETAR
jgi:hypothetical protein